MKTMISEEKAKEKNEAKLQPGSCDVGNHLVSLIHRLRGNWVFLDNKNNNTLRKNKTNPTQGRGENVVEKTLAVQEWRLEFNPRIPKKIKQDAV